MLLSGFLLGITLGKLIEEKLLEDWFAMDVYATQTLSEGWRSPQGLPRKTVNLLLPWAEFHLMVHFSGGGGEPFMAWSVQMPRNLENMGLESWWQTGRHLDRTLHGDTMQEDPHV